MARKILVISRKLFFDLYTPGLRAYGDEYDDITIDLYELDYPKNKLGIIDKLKYKFDVCNFRKKYYAKIRRDLCKIVENYDELLFINLFFDKEYFIQGKFKEILYKKKTNVLFADSIKLFSEEIDFWNVFNRVFSFEFDDIDYAKEKYGIDVEYNPIGTSYFLFDKTYGRKKYDVCFVGLATKNRLEYLEKISGWCFKNNKKLYISGHFWHDNNWLNYHIGKIKFNYKYPMLAKYVKNIFINPKELAQLYCDSKIVLNINVPHHRGFNQRNFDVMMCKSLLICGNQDATGIDVKNGKDFVMCSDADDMIQKINYYLVNNDRRDEIIDNAYIKVENKFLFKHTLDRIFKE